jgi:hypothetical protein
MRSAVGGEQDLGQKSLFFLSKANDGDAIKCCGMRLVREERDFLLRTERRVRGLAIPRNGVPFFEGRTDWVMD